jgi:DNA-directed RNA polymerase alpha subunit
MNRNTFLEKLDISTRSLRNLHSASILTVGDLVDSSLEKIATIDSMTSYSFREIALIREKLMI